ncbi:hypothetical protein ABT215_27090 [Streptomyces sp900105755]|uniref:hypothetical protein n=1 Tax=Streptomyces sp. 900105755 TaxID=3154389 RepID=UPI00332C11F0
MRDDTTSGRAVGFLLDLIDPADADRVRTRVELPRPVPEDLRETRRRIPWGLPALPSSVVLWMLQEDDPDLNAVVWRLLTDRDTALRRAILDGVAFAPGRLLAVEVDPVLRDDYAEPPASAPELTVRSAATRSGARCVRRPRRPGPWVPGGGR